MDPVALPEVGSSDFMLGELFQQADPIVQAVMIVLVIASLWSWGVAIDKWFAVANANGKAKRFESAFWSGHSSLEDLSARSADKASDAMARVYIAGADEWRDARRTGVSGDSQAAAALERARIQMQVAGNRETARMESGLGTLAIIASASPFIGLFGTVIGIMNAFTEIAARGETNLTVVAPGIAEALFATGLGLLAAIPALIFYNKFAGDIARFSERLDNFSQEFAVRMSKRLSERRDA
jgi:biopolymer transport protein TolQ